MSYARVFFLMPFLTTQAQAVQILLSPDVQKKIESVTLEGCGPGAEVRLEAAGASDGVFSETFVIDFSDLSLEGQSHPARRSCQVVSRVKVAAGSRLRINSGAVIGYSDLSQSSISEPSEVSFTYSMPTSASYATARSKYASQRLDDVNLLALMNQSSFTPCSNQDQLVELRGQVLLSLPAQLNSSSAIRITGGAQSAGTSWNWGWGSCFHGTFKSQYTAYNGQSYNATFTLKGPNTTFESSAGFSGQLLDLKRNGRVLSGRWSSGEQSGYVEFRFQDYVSGRFEGEWGELGPQGERYYKGRWNGQKAGSKEDAPSYQLSTLWQGTGKVLTADTSSLPLLEALKGTSTQTWKMQIIKDTYVRLSEQATGQCLDIDGGTQEPKLANCGDYSGQYWRLVPISDQPYYRLKTLFTGDDQCLDVINDGRNDRLRMAPCSAASGQFWWVENRPS